MENIEPKYFLLNKKEDYEKGYSNNLKIQDESIYVENQSKGKAIFLSQFYDSGDLDNNWYRLRIGKQGNGILKLTYYCCNDISYIYEAMNNELTYEEIDQLMENFKIKTVVNPFDLLLYDAKGRYFWFKLEILDLNKEATVIKSIKIEYPMQSLVRYLPEFYQDDQESRSFLDGYLGIFEALYMDLEKVIDNISHYFDPDTTDKEFLEWLAKWVKVENTYIWKEDKLRYLLKNIVGFYKNAGTVKGMSDIIELYAGEKPYIVEYFQIKEYMKYVEQADMMLNLYGDNPYEFTVILSEKSIPSEKEYKEIYKLIEEFKPAHTEVKLIILKPYVFLGNYTYLGINTFLNSDRSMELDGMAKLAFTRIE